MHSISPFYHYNRQWYGWGWDNNLIVYRDRKSLTTMIAEILIVKLSLGWICFCSAANSVSLDKNGPVKCAFSMLLFISTQINRKHSHKKNIVLSIFIIRIILSISSPTIIVTGHFLIVPSLDIDEAERRTPANLFGQSTCFVWRVENLVEEHREVKGQA